MRSPGPAFDLRAALAQEVRGAAAELEVANDDPKAVHRCRVRLKRARALARIGSVCAPGLSSVFNDSARSVMRILAQQRDLLALSEAARAAAKKAGKKTAAALRTTATALDAQAEERGVDREAASNGLKDLLALSLVWPEESPRQVYKGAKRIARRARKACRRGHAAKEVARRHEWRKREKDRFFAATLLDKAWPEARKRKLGEKLGDVLGDERDALLLIDKLIAEPLLAGEGAAPRRALKSLRRRRQKLAKRADAIGQKLHGADV